MLETLDDIVKVRKWNAFSPLLDKVALICGDKEYTFDDLDNHSGMIAERLQANGVKGNVAILLGNRAEAVFSLFAVSKSGNTFIILNDQTRPKRLCEILADAECDAIITDSKHMEVVESAPCSVRYVLNIDTMRLVNLDYVWQEASTRSHLGAIMYTSGSTGRPKGVMCPHKNMIAAIEIINEYLFHDEEYRILTTLPLSHGYGLYQVLAPLAAGSTVILEPGFSLAPPILKRIHDLNVNGFAVVPSMLSLIFKTKCWKEQMQGLTYLTNAGAALPPAYFELLKKELPGTRIMPMYGQTECVRALYYPNGWHQEGKRIHSSGVAIPRTELKLADDGELIVDGPTVMAGYWKKVSETHRVFKRDGLHTGDLFEQDEDGLFYYVGRKDDVIKIKGERVAPQEIDNVIYDLAGVDEAASFAVEDEAWGNKIIIYVASQSLTRLDIMRYCKVNLEPFMMPKDVVIVPKLPKNENGKISRSILKKHYLETH